MVTCLTCLQVFKNYDFFMWCTTRRVRPCVKISRSNSLPKIRKNSFTKLQSDSSLLTAAYGKIHLKFLVYPIDEIPIGDSSNNLILSTVRIWDHNSIPKLSYDIRNGLQILPENAAWTFDTEKFIKRSIFVEKMRFQWGFKDISWNYILDSRNTCFCQVLFRLQPIQVGCKLWLGAVWIQLSIWTCLWHYNTYS